VRAARLSCVYERFVDFTGALKNPSRRGGRGMVAGWKESRPSTELLERRPCLEQALNFQKGSAKNGTGSLGQRGELQKGQVHGLVMAEERREKSIYKESQMPVPTQGNSDGVHSFTQHPSGEKVKKRAAGGTARTKTTVLEGIGAVSALRAGHLASTKSLRFSEESTGV